MAGRPVVIGEPDDIISVKLDFSAMLDVDEAIEDVTINGNATLLQYSYQSLIFTCAQFSDCPALFSVSVKFSSGERFTERFTARTPARYHEHATTAAAQRRGAL